jgi:hypothetical protein
VSKSSKPPTSSTNSSSFAKPYNDSTPTAVNSSKAKMTSSRSLQQNSKVESTSPSKIDSSKSTAATPSVNKTRIVLEPEPRKMQAERPVLLQDLSQSKLLLKYKQQIKDTATNSKEAEVELNSKEPINKSINEQSQQASQQQQQQSQQQQQQQQPSQQNINLVKPVGEFSPSANSSSSSKLAGGVSSAQASSSAKTSKLNSENSSQQSTPKQGDIIKKTTGKKLSNTTSSPLTKSAIANENVGGVYGADIYDGGGIYGADMISAPIHKDSKASLNFSKQSSPDKASSKAESGDYEQLRHISLDESLKIEETERKENAPLKPTIKTTKNDSPKLETNQINTQGYKSIEEPSEMSCLIKRSMLIDTEESIGDSSNVVTFSTPLVQQHAHSTSQSTTTPRKPMPFNPLHVILKDKNKYYTTEYI